MMLAVIAGCDTTSSIEGQVVDGKGRPLSGVMLIARQEPSVNVGEHLEAVTAEDGGFTFRRMSSYSKYVLIPYTDKYFAERRFEAESGGWFQTRRLTPLELRFDARKAGIVIDTKTGLAWARNANIAIRPMEWTEAVKWTRQLNYAGFKSGWRLPAKKELEEFLTMVNREGIIQKEFQNVQLYASYWSATPHATNASIAWSVSLGGYTLNHHKSVELLAWPVRDGL